MMEDADRLLYRKALGHFPTGVAVMTAKPAAGAAIGLTVNSFASVSLDPPLVLWCLRRDAYSLPAIQDAQHFVVNVLGADQEELAQQFARPSSDRFAGVSHTVNGWGAPLLDGCVAYFDCTLVSQQVGGDHVILVGGVERFACHDRQPLMFCRGQFVPLGQLVAAR